jgi:predicted HTH domain antitoxin
VTYKVTTIRLPEDTIEALNELGDKLDKERSEIMREALQIGVNEMKLRIALELYTKGKISFGRLAEHTDLSHRELYKELKQRKIPYRYGEERFNEEIQQLVK